MKSFLGMCGVYRLFVADFAKIAKALTALTSTKLPKRLPSPRKKEKKHFEELRVFLSRPHPRSAQERRALHR